MTNAPPPPQNPSGPQGAAPQQQPNAPLIMHGQYIKDLSFENPRAPQKAYGPLLFIEPPRLLSPFPRAVVANAPREAGSPPLNIAPVDFVALYRQQLEANGGKVPGVASGPVGHA